MFIRSVLDAGLSTCLDTSATGKLNPRLRIADRDTLMRVETPRRLSRKETLESVVLAAAA